MNTSRPRIEILLVTLCFASGVSIAETKDDLSDLAFLFCATEIANQLATQAAEDPRGRFDIDTMPYTGLIKFETKKAEKGVLISWETNAQENVEYFDLSRSLDGKKYESIYQVKGAGTTKEKSVYEYLDEKAYEIAKDATQIFYQLAQIGLDKQTDPIGNTSLLLSSIDPTQPDNINQLIPQLTPKSPTVAGLERYNSFPVSLYTGQAMIDIPVYTIQTGDVTIPIKLSYHAGGHKVLDHAGWCGLGWSVTGQYDVTVDTRGIGDATGGLLGKDMPSIPTFINCLTPGLKDTLLEHINFVRDLERDVFTYRTPRKSNSFVITPGGNIFLEADKSKVIPNTGLGTFSLTDEMGYRYYYGTQESVTSNYVNNVSTWHLDSLLTNMPAEKLRYTYHPAEQYSYLSEITHYQVYHTDLCQNAPVNSGFAYFQEKTNTADITARPLKEIIFPGGKIEFVLENQVRTDGLGHALDKIRIYSYDFDNNNYSLERTFELDYIYKERSSSAGQMVLFLDKVRMLGKTGTEVGRYTFEYNNLALPKTTSYAKDHQGYFNGQTFNTTLIPNQTISWTNTCGGGSGSETLSQGNREPNETSMQAWMLEKMNLPTGGWESYFYEANKYVQLPSTQKTGGGLRIRKIQKNDGSGNTITRFYRYGTNESGYGTDRTNNVPTTLITEQEMKLIGAPNYPYDYRYTIKTYMAGVNSIVNPYESAIVTYPEVTVYEDSLGTVGKTVYTFKDNAFDVLSKHPGTNRMALQSQHWNRGQTLSKTLFGVDGLKKLEEKNTITAIIPVTSTPTLGYILGRTEVRVNPGPPQSGCLMNDDEYGTSGPIAYQWKTGLVRATRTETWEYHQSNLSRYRYTKRETDYDATWYQPKENRLFGSDDSVRVQRLRYCTDITGLAVSNQGYARAIWQMKENNEILRPVEVLHLFQKPGATNARLLGGTLNQDTSFSFGGHTYVLPKRKYLLETERDTRLAYSSFVPAKIVSNNLQWDSHYALRVVLDSYDTYGNLSQFYLPAGASTSLTHSTEILDVYHKRTINETKNKNGLTEYPTLFDIRKPVLGVEKTTAPNLLQDTFAFDHFGRFYWAKDHDGHLVIQQAYNYLAPDNYVRKYVPRVEMTSLTGNHQNYETITDYFDGLGRPLQTMHLKAHPNGINNIVTGAMTYSTFGIVDRQYRSYQDNGSGAVSSPPGTFFGDTYPYSQVTEFDNSPLHRPRKVYGLGKTWRDSTKYIEQNYYAPSAGVIRLYRLNDDGSVTSRTNYGGNKLLHNVSVSEEVMSTRSM